jgi:hypothetical protein
MKMNYIGRIIAGLNFHVCRITLILPAQRTLLQTLLKFHTAIDA